MVLKYFRLMKAVADGKVIVEYIYNGKGQRIIKKTARLRTGSLVSPVGAIPSPYAGVDFGLDALIGFTTGKGETTCCTQ